MRLSCGPCRASHWIRSKQNRASSRTEQLRSIAIWAIEAAWSRRASSCSTMRALADADFVHDELARHDAEDELLAAFERDERPLARFDGGLANLAGRRIGVELLDGAPEEQQELVHRRRRPRAGASPSATGLDRHTRASRSGTAAAQTCQSAIRNVIACACVDRHGLSFSLADTQMNANERSDLACGPGAGRGGRAR